MSIIDTILGIFGLQRKTTQQEGTLQEQVSHPSTPENPFDRIWERQYKAVTNFAGALYDIQSKRIEEFTQKMQEGNLTPEESERYISEISHHVEMMGKLAHPSQSEEKTN